jgi:hypothetical protein
VLNIPRGNFNNVKALLQRFKTENPNKNAGKKMTEIESHLFKTSAKTYHALFDHLIRPVIQSRNNIQNE